MSEKRGPGRPRKDTDPPAADHTPPLEDRAQRNVFATVKLLGRVIGSTEKLTEDEFEDIGRGIASLRALFPKAEKDIEGAVDALGPAATVLDLADKLTRLFSKSKLREKTDEAIARVRQRGEGESAT